MTDPILIAIAICAGVALIHALWPVITGNAAWLMDRDSELTAAALSAILMVSCFALHRPAPQVIDRVVTREVTPEEAMDILVRDRVRSALTEK